MSTTATSRVIGITDEQTACDRCGKIDLRATVIVGDEDGAELGRYGTSCVARVMGMTSRYTLRNARAREAARRQYVMDDLKSAARALAAGDVASMLMYIRDARRTGVIRADEKAIIATMI